ncbi:cadherin-99C-like [Gigantopelta aegis]|uniref:cadherin-99C-like n=1 Tax=Gigantopelta aegis TaxID=1735272 RepID=UPI001B889180|nr:cadherin-99C-like [Gigantopelta aegis]
MLQILKDFAIQKDERFLLHVQELESLTQATIVKHRCERQQTSMDTFLNLTPVGRTILQSISAVDKDLGKNGSVSYSILPGKGNVNDGSQKFGISTSSPPVLTVLQPLDFESVNEVGIPIYELVIQAKDQPDSSVNQLTTTTKVTVLITDGDDQGPVYEYRGCKMTTQKPFVCYNAEYSVTVKAGETVVQKG